MSILTQLLIAYLLQSKYFFYSFSDFMWWNFKVIVYQSSKFTTNTLAPNDPMIRNGHIKITTFENTQRFHRTWLGRKWETASEEVIHLSMQVHLSLRTVTICCATKIIVRNEMWQSKNSSVFCCALNNLKTSHVIDIIILI